MLGTIGYPIAILPPSGAIAALLPSELIAIDQIGLVTPVDCGVQLIPESLLKYTPPTPSAIAATSVFPSELHAIERHCPLGSPPQVQLPPEFLLIRTPPPNITAASFVPSSLIATDVNPCPDSFRLQFEPESVLVYIPLPFPV